MSGINSTSNNGGGGGNFMSDIRAVPPDASLLASNRRGSMGPPAAGRRLVPAGGGGSSSSASAAAGGGSISSYNPPAGNGSNSLTSYQPPHHHSSISSAGGGGGGRPQALRLGSVLTTPGAGIGGPTTSAMVAPTTAAMGLDGTAGGGGENTRPVKINVANIEELQALLDRDADCIVNIRRDIVQSQAQELERARDMLMKQKKAFDAARIGNKQKEHQLSTLYDKLRVLEAFYDTHKDTISSHQGVLEEIERKIAVVDENLAADRRTRKVLQAMSSRLEVEIERVKAKSQHVSQAMDLKRTELHGHETALRGNRQELKEEERKLAELNRLSKSRAAQRATRLAQLQALAMVEASRSPKRSHNQDDFEDDIGVDYFRGIVRNLNGNNAATTAPITSLSSNNNSNTSANNAGRAPNSRGSTADTTDSRGEGGEAGAELTTAQLFEATELYANRASRIEKLEGLQGEFRDKINGQKQRKVNLEEMLEKTLRDREALTSSRQLFQEVDAKDSALSAARRKYQHVHLKDERLRESLESLRRFVPRLLTKITKLNQPTPNMDQLPDALHKVEDEVSRLIKLIGEILLRDATPEDLAAVTEMSGVSDLGRDERSESSRLHKLPGFARLQRQLFINMMTAVPDGSSRNVRVMSEDRRVVHSSEVRNAPLPGDQPQRPGMAAVMESTYSYLSSGADTSLDRRTVKEISKLVLTRDSAGHKGGKPGKNRTIARN